MSSNSLSRRAIAANRGGVRCRASMPFERARAVHRAERIPRTPLGKLRRGALLEAVVQASFDLGMRWGKALRTIPAAIGVDVKRWNRHPYPSGYGRSRRTPGSLKTETVTPSCTAICAAKAKPESLE